VDLLAEQAPVSRDPNLLMITSTEVSKATRSLYRPCAAALNSEIMSVSVCMLLGMV
jgi:hypothetical protein